MDTDGRVDGNGWQAQRDSGEAVRHPWRPLLARYAKRTHANDPPSERVLNRRGDRHRALGLAFSFDARRPPGARSVANDAALARCTAEDKCLEEAPSLVVGGSGVSGGAFIDNAAFRTWAFETFGARVLDMESAAVAHVAYANGVPFIAIRSLSDLAGGGEGANQMEVFLGLAAGNAASVVKALLRAMPGEP